MARFLVTGGAGFIGSHLVRGLLERGDEVNVLDNFATGSRANLAEVADRIRLVEGSLADPEAVRAALDGVEGVLHQGALPSVPVSLERPLDTHMANAFGTLNLLEQCRSLGVRRLVYAASSSAYGDQEAAVKDESLTPKPLSPYAVQKLTAERYCQVYTSLFGVETIALRYFNVFGPRQNPRSQYAAVVPAFITRMLAGVQPVIFGDGRQSRDFTYIGNVVSANLKALVAPSAATGKVYNAACGQSITLLQLVGFVNKILGTDLTPIHEAPRAGDVKHSCADTRAATAAFGFTAETSVLEGLRTTVDWYRENGEWNR